MGTRLGEARQAKPTIAKVLLRKTLVRADARRRFAALEGDG